MKVEKYFLRASDATPWQRVSKEDWIKAERAAGFHPKLPSTDPDYMTTCATGGFGGSGVSGKVVYEEEDAPLTSARNIGELRRLLEGASDDTPLVIAGGDHAYFAATAGFTTALYSRRTGYTEDHGEALTPEATYGKRVNVLVVS